MRTLILATLLALAGMHSSAFAEEQRPDPYVTKTEPITDGIFLVKRPDPTRQPVMGNGTIIVNDDHLVLIDGAGSPLIADRLIDHIRSLSELPVKYYVTTHWHGDHSLGVHRLQAVWPGMEIIGHEFTAAAMKGKPMAYVKRSADTVDARLDHLKAITENRRLPDGSPVAPHLMQSYLDMVQNRRLIIEQAKAAVIFPPEKTFSDRLILDEGGRRIELLHFGPANTGGDIVAWLPDDRILVTGDIVVRPTPFGIGSYPRSWVKVLQQLEDLEPETIIPGHGEVLYDTAHLRQLQTLVTSVADQSDAAVADGINAFEFLQALDLDEFRDGLTGGDPWLNSRFDAWFATPIATAGWREAAGQEVEPLE